MFSHSITKPKLLPNTNTALTSGGAPAGQGDFSAAFRGLGNTEKIEQMDCAAGFVAEIPKICKMHGHGEAV